MKKSTTIASVLVAQALLITAACWQPLLARATGQEVRLRVGAYDPVDPFRGAYVALQYPDLADTIVNPDGTVPGDVTRRVYLSLQDRGGYSTVASRADHRPASGIYLDCRRNWDRPQCGIESYFLPQGRAAQVGQALSDGGAIAVIKVDRWGHAALVGLELPPAGTPTVRPTPPGVADPSPVPE